MKHKSLLFCAMMILLSSCTMAQSKKKSETNTLIPQAKPVLDFFLAIQNSDLNRVKSVLSEKSKPLILSDAESAETIEAMKAGLIQCCGTDYDPRNFEYLFEGNDEDGSVLYTLPDGTYGSYDVVLENNVWKINFDTKPFVIPLDERIALSKEASKGNVQAMGKLFDHYTKGTQNYEMGYFWATQLKKHCEMKHIQEEMDQYIEWWLKENNKTK